MKHDDENKPGGVRPPDYIYTMALARIEDLMMQAYSWPDIFAKLVAEGFTESENTAKSWRKEIQRRWAAEDAENRPARKDMWRGRLEALYHKLLTKAGSPGLSASACAMLYAEAIKVAKIAVVMDGLTAPVRVEHSGAVDVAALQPHERETEIRELLAKREAALQQAAKTSGKVYS